MSLNWNNVKPACCTKWLVLPTVYSDALSYGEQLDKFCYQLNQLIENNNILPDFIAETVKEYINSGEIGEVVRDILANYILNVKYPPNGITPAVGDGSADDTNAIQGCIDYAAENGGVVYFPYGTYLTQSVSMKDGVSLFGFDRYSTKLVLKGGATNALLNGNVKNVGIYNITLDSNAGIQVNNVDVINVTGGNIELVNAILDNGYNLFKFTGVEGHLQIDNVVFGSAVECGLIIAGESDVQVENVIFNELSAVSGKYVIDIGSNNGTYEFTSHARCETCMNISGNNNYIQCTIINAVNNYIDTGNGNNVYVYGKSKKEHFSNDVTMYTGGNKSEIVALVNEIKADTIFLNPSKPLKYGEVIKNGNTEYVTFMDKNNTPYNVLVNKVPSSIVINVKDYGATGDGVTDDTSSFITAINSLINGGTIFIPNGTYLLSDTINIDKSNVNIIGETKYGCVLKRNTNYGNTFTVKGNTLLTCVNMYNFTILHDITTVAMDGYHIEYTNVNQFTLKDIYTENGKKSIVLNGCVDCNLYNLILVGRSSDNNLHNGDAGIELNNDVNSATPLCTQVRMYGCRIFGPRVSGWKSGFRSNGSEEVEITNCYIGNNRFHNIELAQKTAIILETTISGCYIDASGSHSIYLNGTGGDGSLYIGNTKIANNNIKGQSGDGYTGIFCDKVNRGGSYPFATNGLIINGNTISGMSSNGIWIDGGNDIIITNNQCDGNNYKSESGDGRGILIGESVNHCLIANNLVGAKSMSNSGGTQKQLYGIELVSGCLNVTVANNDLRFNRNAFASPLLVGEAGNAIYNNIGYNGGLPITSPAIPSSGVEMLNPYGTACWVSIYGGTVSDIKINGTTVASASGVMFEMGLNDKITVTYSEAPNWSWWRH